MRWSKKEIEFIKENYKDMTDKEIGDKLGKSRSSIEWKRSKDLGLKKEPHYSENEAHFLKENYLEMSQKELAKKFDRTVASVAQKAGKLGLKKPYEERDLHPEVNPDLSPTPALGYILGVLKGDGCVSKTKNSSGSGHKYLMNLQVTDSSFAQCFKAALKEIELNPQGPYYQEFSNKSDTYQVAAYSKDFYEWYQNLSLDYIQDFLETREMKKEFIRGIYESEGSFYRKGHRWGVSICSTDLEFLKFIKSMIKKIGFECLKINEKGQKRQLNNHQFTAYRIRIKGGASKIIEFLKEINPCISRKSLESVDFSDQRGIKHPRNRWSEEEEDFLRENYEKNEMTVKKICEKLGRSKSSVTCKAQSMGLSKFSIPKENKQE